MTEKSSPPIKRNHPVDAARGKRRACGSRARARRRRHNVTAVEPAAGVTDVAAALGGVELLPLAAAAAPLGFPVNWHAAAASVSVSAAAVSLQLFRARSVARSPHARPIARRRRNVLSAAANSHVTRDRYAVLPLVSMNQNL